MRRIWFLGLGFLAACGDTIIYQIVGNQPGDAGDAAVSATADAAATDSAADGSKVDAPTSLVDAGDPDGSNPADGSAGDATVFGDASNNDAQIDGPISLLDASASDSKSDVVFAFDAGGGSDSTTTPDACAQTAVEAKPIGIDLYVMLDKSGSMFEPSTNKTGDCNVGQTVNSKWCKSINALATYFATPSPSGNRAALQFFSGSQVGAQCNGSEYTTPVVPIGLGFVALPDTTQFVPALNTEKPGDNTPTEAALRGMIVFTSNTQTYVAGRQRVGVLVTDGKPTYCDTSAANLAALADTHYTNTGVPIFMVGMDGADFTHLETMAVGGHAATHAKNAGGLTNACGNGKSQCQSWNIGDGSNNALTVALEQIQYEAASCTFAMPTSDGGIIDPKTVNVEYLQGGVNTKTLSRVTGASSCTSAGGFYFDNNNSPTTIKLCPTTCDTVRADSKAKVQVKLGCEGS